ncbi:MAG TPA: hypothetical protein VGO67_01080 [Verrucomicrobiae bacterium]|jgi:hypothetical protein
MPGGQLYYGVNHGVIMIEPRRLASKFYEELRHLKAAILIAFASGIKKERASLFMGEMTRHPLIVKCHVLVSLVVYSGTGSVLAGVNLWVVAFGSDVI